MSGDPPVPGKGAWRPYLPLLALVGLVGTCASVAVAVPRPFGPEAGLLGIALWLAAAAARAWRSAEPSLERPRAAFGTSRGWRATFRAAVALFAPLPLAVGLLLDSVARRASGGLHGALHDASSAFVGLTVLLALLGLAVYFLNRPAFAVPPAYRTLPGLLREWRLAAGGRSAIDEWEREQRGPGRPPD